MITADISHGPKTFTSVSQSQSAFGKVCCRLYASCITSSTENSLYL